MAAVTAVLATGAYVPPFAANTQATATTHAIAQIATTATTAATQAASVVFASVVQATGGNTATASNAFSTSNGLTTDNYEDYFLIPYLEAHSLSWPSFRYAYILWIIIGGLIIVWSVLHFLFRGHGGVLSAIMRKWGIRRFEFGKSKKEVERTAKNAAGYGSATQPQVVHRAKYATPTLGQLFSCLIILVAVFCVSYVGPDYLAPTECLFGGICNPAVSQGPPESTFRLVKPRSLEERVADPDLPVPASPAKPRALSQEEPAELVKRIGVYATQPLNPSGWAPFNDPLLASTNTAVAKDFWTSGARTGLIAYALVPLVVTLALRLWPYAVFATPFLTNYSFDKTAMWHRWIGRLIWALSTVHVGLWTYQLFKNTDPYGRYIWYEVWRYWRFRAGVVGYTGLTAMVVLSFAPVRAKAYEVFYYSHIVFAIIFMVGCLLHFYVLQWWLVVGLALWGAERFSRFVNWLYINGFTRGIGLMGKADRYMDNKMNQGYTEKKLPAAPGLGYAYAQPRAAQSDMTLADSYSFSYSKSPLSSPSPSFYGQIPRGGPYLNQSNDVAVVDVVAPPAGYAVAQILPGRTIRLTFRPPVPVHWKPGQHCLMTVPKVSWWESHPYTFANCDATALREGRNDMVFLIQARKGFSLALFKHVTTLRRRYGPGVLVRTQISFSMGSAGRAYWGDYKSVFLVIGGTGVSFGLSVFEYVCRAMAARKAGNQMSDGRPFQTTQIHFLWIVREWAHLAWIAPTVHRCLQMSQPGSVRVSLYIATKTPLLGISNSMTSPAFQADNASGYFFDQPPSRSLRPEDAEEHNVYESALDYVLFDGEEAHSTAAERAASSTVKRAGTLRRERTARKSRAAEMKAMGATGDATDILYPPRPPRATSPVASQPRPQSRNQPWAQSDNRRWSGASFASEATLTGAHDDVYMSDGGKMPRSRSATPMKERPTASPSASAIALSLKGDADESLLDVVGADREALDQIAELAVEGRPKIEQVFRDEIQRAGGSMIVGCCGPTSLNVLMRKLVADAISPTRIFKGDMRYNIDLVCEGWD